MRTKDWGNRTLVLVILAAMIVSIIACSGGFCLVRAEGENSLTSSRPIRVDNDTELASLINSMHFNGAGTLSDPYVIQNLSFERNTVVPSMYIGNTTSYLTVRNCSNDANNSQLLGAGGIILCNVTNALLENNHFNHTHRAGIWLLSSSNDTISNNVCNRSPGGSGVLVEDSRDIIVSDNKCNQNGDCVCLWSSSYNIVKNNSGTGNADTIAVLLSSNNTISGNNCSKDPEGIVLIQSSDNTLSNNECGNAGISISYGSNNILSGNSGNVSISPVDGGGYMKDCSPVFIVLVVVLLALVAVLAIRGRKDAG